MTDNRTTELREGLTKRGIVYRTTEVHGMPVTTYKSNGLTWSATEHSDGSLVLSCVGVTPEQAIAATLGDETPKKCSTCQYRYVVGQRPYPTFGYMCGFGDGKKLCGRDTSVLDHMCCEHWEKELR